MPQFVSRQVCGGCMLLQRIPDDSQSFASVLEAQVEDQHPGAAQQDARTAVQRRVRDARGELANDLQSARVGHVLALQFEQICGAPAVPALQGIFNRFDRRLVAREPATGCELQASVLSRMLIALTPLEVLGEQRLVSVPGPLVVEMTD